ncbi:MAG: TrmH family RNA methyltransferase [Bifidobacterium sp.]|nr:TrmH family RNA methyltransferase [Bifidobacterium sp.]MCH4174783.1 TrmH family RNA methyltransferase [Bifidobacterium sp.]
MSKPSAFTQASLASGEPVFRTVGVGPWSQTHPDQARPDDPSSSNYDPRFDTELLDEGDRRNVLDRFRYWSVEAIRDDLDLQGRHQFEVAIENWTHDFNIGSIVRTANAFAAAKVHIVGPHKWNRKGALMTELYQHVEQHPSMQDLLNQVEADDAARGDHERTSIIAIDNVPGAVAIEHFVFPKRCLLLFGAEGPGLSQKALDCAEDVVFISQFGSVRSINAGAAAAVAMHCWIMQHS